MVAARHLEHAARVGKHPLLYILHPRPVDGEWNVVLGLAGYRAGVTTDALAVVNDKSVSHRQGLSEA